MIDNLWLSVNFYKSIKTKLLLRELGDAGVTTLQRLWIYAATEQPTGDLSGLSPDKIEIAADWAGERGLFYKTLVDLEFLDVSEDGSKVTIHDWLVNNPQIAEYETQRNVGRLNRIKQLNRNLWEKLTSQGCAGLSEAQYLEYRMQSTGVIVRGGGGDPQGMGGAPSGGTGGDPQVKGKDRIGKERMGMDRNGKDGIGTDRTELLVPGEPAVDAPPALERPAFQVQDCPHLKIVELYHEILPQCTQVKSWTDARRKLLLQRWREDPERQTLDWWREYFTRVSKSDFLTGKIQRGDRPPFLADLEWLIRPSNLVKVCEGRYDNRGDAWDDIIAGGYDAAMASFYDS